MAAFLGCLCFCLFGVVCSMRVFVLCLFVLFFGGMCLGSAFFPFVCLIVG